MNLFQDMFERQKRHFATGATRSYAWRVEQLDRMGRLIGDNEAALRRAIAQDFKTASQEQLFETLACLGEVAFQKSWRPSSSAAIRARSTALPANSPSVAAQ
jgi:aldehyde dehydrogenase (NAD+)